MGGQTAALYKHRCYYSTKAIQLMGLQPTLGRCATKHDIASGEYVHNSSYWRKDHWLCISSIPVLSWRIGTFSG